MNVATKKSWGTAPFWVDLVAVITLCKAAFLLFFGLIGILAQNSVSDPWGEGLIAIGVVLAVLGWILPRGSRIARFLLAAIAALSGIAAIVWAFNAPRSALIEALVMLGFAVVVLVLLFVPEQRQGVLPEDLAFRIACQSRSAFGARKARASSGSAGSPPCLNAFGMNARPPSFSHSASAIVAPNESDIASHVTRVRRPKRGHEARKSPKKNTSGRPRRATPGRPGTGNATERFVKTCGLLFTILCVGPRHTE